jgi:hypothetical protein
MGVHLCGSIEIDGRDRTRVPRYFSTATLRCNTTRFRAEFFRIRPQLPDALLFFTRNRNFAPAAALSAPTFQSLVSGEAHEPPQALRPPRCDRSHHSQQGFRTASADRDPASRRSRRARHARFRLGTQIGQMYLRGKVAASEYSAARRWSALVADYAVACQAPREPQTASLEARGGTPADPDSDAGVKEARKHRRDTAAYLDGKQALRLAGATAERVVEDVCILDQAPAGLVELNALRSGLQSLAAHWSARRKANVR